MINVAMVNQEGAVSHVTSPATDDMYSDGVQYGEYTARFLEQGVSISYAIERLYWDNGWQTREAKPNDFYSWESTGWVFNPSIFWEAVRLQREHLLSNSDWTQMPDSPLTTTEKAEWTAYRQALRSIPQVYPNATALGDLVWPTEPN
jgi:hypothetical protein